MWASYGRGFANLRGVTIDEISAAVSFRQDRETNLLEATNINLFGAASH
jgi:hypothetical protein